MPDLDITVMENLEAVRELLGRVQQQLTEQQAVNIIISKRLAKAEAMNTAFDKQLAKMEVALALAQAEAPPSQNGIVKEPVPMM